MPKRRKATNASIMDYRPAPSKKKRAAVKRKTRKAVKGAAKDVLAAYPLHRAVKGAVKALATTVPKKVMGAATTGLGTEAVAKILKDIKPGSPTAKKLLKLLNSAPTKGPVARTIRGRVTDKDIARRRKVKKKRLKRRK